MNNFITNTEETITLKERLQKLISGSYELKFLVGFFYFSGWQEIYHNVGLTRSQAPAHSLIHKGNHKGLPLLTVGL